MEYAFPTERAMMCIPDFHGKSKDLEGFLFLIDFFAKRSPDGESEEELIQVVMIKLKRKAASLFNRIVDESWDNVKTNLIKQFGENVKVEAIFQQVETLQQEFNEPFTTYMHRILKLKEQIMNN